MRVWRGPCHAALRHRPLCSTCEACGCPPASLPALHMRGSTHTRLAPQPHEFPPPSTGYFLSDELVMSGGSDEW